MVEAALFSITSILIRKLVSPSLKKFGSFDIGVEKDLKKLQRVFTAIQSMLKDADEQRWSGNAIRFWLGELVDLAYDLDDILDEIETENLRCRVEIRGRTVNKVRDFFTPSNSVVFKFKMINKIRKVVERFDLIEKLRHDFDLTNRHVYTRNETGTRIQTPSYVHESEVLGRDDEREKLVQLLINMGDEEEQNVSVIPIVGMGGLGKTTLTKLVYNDDRVKSYFDQKMWAYVSENFNHGYIIRAILESANEERCDLKSMEALQSRLRKTLDGKKYLLVLDDVWNENRAEWLDLKGLLNVGARGSKILVTTRTKKVASIMTTGFTHELKELSDEHCWSLFKEWAFPQRDEQMHPNLIKIGKEIINRCKGVPFAIMGLGGLLHDIRRESYWQHVRDDEIWNLSDHNFLPTLKLSYNHLPSQLKQCFTFCSLLPKGDTFEKDTLIQMWIAEGFIQPSKYGELMEDIGIKYFDELCCRSLLQEVPNKATFKLHDLIHDLARSIGQSESLVVEARRIKGVFEGTRISKRTRHLSFICTETISIDPMSFCNAKKIRTFLLSGCRWGILEVSNIISSLKLLRVLDLSYTSIKTLPNSIEKLKHLRYLNLSVTRIETLPESICSLQNLQTLKLLKCHYLRKLPNDMWKMISLRHLEIDCYDGIVQMPPRIGELKNLQTLPIFIVGKERRQGIDELQGLNLHGELEIKNLQSVLNPSDAEKVQLREKQHLCSLRLSWEYVNDLKASEIENHEYVIESLQPHSKVQKLSIENYMGTKFPRWLMLLEFPNLVEVSFVNCKRCEILPPLWQLHHLEVLTLNNMPNLEKMFIEETRKLLPKTNSLTHLPHLPALRHLTLIECNEMILISFEACPAIISLEIGGFPHMTSLPEGLLKNKSCLTHLSVRDCPKLKSLSKDLHDLVAIETLSIKNCRELAILPESLDKLTALKYLSISDLPKLASLPKEIGNLTSLQNIRPSCLPKAFEPARITARGHHTSRFNNYWMSHFREKMRQR